MLEKYTFIVNFGYSINVSTQFRLRNISGFEKAIVLKLRKDSRLEYIIIHTLNFKIVIDFEYLKLPSCSQLVKFLVLFWGKLPLNYI